MEERKIIHIDMDAFYAAVEQRDNPDLRGKPVAVGGSKRRGVVASASYEARKYGVRSAMPSITAARLCPQLIFVKSRFNVYREVSGQIREIFQEYTDLVEPLSLDEAYLDVTYPKMGKPSATLIAKEILIRITEKTRLTASAGVSFNKFLAKTASDINKPNGMKVITPEQAVHFLEQLPIEKFHGIGKVTAQKMHRMGIYSGADLKKLSEMEMVTRFGKVGRHYFRIVRADDSRVVNPHRIRKSIGAERTFSEDILNLTVMEEKIEQIAGIVYRYMEKTDNYGRTLTVKIKLADFQILTRSKTFSSELRQESDIINVAKELLRNNIVESMEIRLLGISMSNLMHDDQLGGIQLELQFEE